MLLTSLSCDDRMVQQNDARSLITEDPPLSPNAPPPLANGMPTSAWSAWLKSLKSLLSHTHTTNTMLSFLVTLVILVLVKA